MTNENHISVLHEEFLSYYRGRAISCFVDATLGAGGHSKAILEEHPEIEILIGIDQDPVALKIAEERLQPWSSKLRLTQGNFEGLKKYLKKMNIEKVDGIFFDLGVSSMQLDTDERGFSFMRDGPLDMRMDPNEELTAEIIVNSWREEDIANTIYELGEERASRRIAKAIVEARRKARIMTTKALADIIAGALGRRGRMHPATLTFQGLRLAVNRELDVIRSVLPEAISLLSDGGRLGVISFHSLEDRIIKETFRNSAKSDHSLHILTKKPIVPTREEERRNPRSRSAKMRFCEKNILQNDFETEIAEFS